MRRYAILLVLMLAGLYWLVPWLRRMNVAQAQVYPWLPVLGPDGWSVIVLVMVVLAVLAGLMLVVKLGIFVWRELID